MEKEKFSLGKTFFKALFEIAVLWVIYILVNYMSPGAIAVDAGLFVFYFSLAYLIILVVITAILFLIAMLMKK